MTPSQHPEIQAPSSSTSEKDPVASRRRFFGKAATAAVAAPLAGFPMISVAQSPVVLKMQGAWGSSPGSTRWPVDGCGWNTCPRAPSSSRSS